jgi:hypothetical protein
MKLLIDNLDGLGARDYTAQMRVSNVPRVARKLNLPAELKVSLVSGGLPVPVIRARITLVLSNGKNLFTGYIFQAPTFQHEGFNDHGAVYGYEIDALSDVSLLDEKAPPPHPPFVDRSAGDALEQLATEALPGWFDVSQVEPGDAIPYYSVDPAKKWTASAAEIALSGRCSYRDEEGKLYFAPLATNLYPLAESDPAFCPGNLKLESVNRLVNDLTVLGPIEPSAHVRDYFVATDIRPSFTCRRNRSHAAARLRFITERFWMRHMRN